jgi:hypothetical protein
MHDVAKTQDRNADRVMLGLGQLDSIQNYRNVVTL